MTAGHFLHARDRRLEAWPGVRVWLNECEDIMLAHFELVSFAGRMRRERQDFAYRRWVKFSELQDPWDWRDRASRFLDEVAADVRSRIEPNPRDVLRSVLPAFD